jgi:hypothetical protein
MLGQPDLLVNFYELPEMRKYMDDLEDKQVDKTGMALSKPHVLVCGSTGSGKSQWLLNYILRTSNTFLKIIMVVEKMEPFNLFLQDKLKDNIQFIVGLEALPPVETFIDSVRMKKGEKYRTLIVFDDQIVAVTKSKANQAKINSFFTYGRNKLIQLLFLTQSYYACPKFLRLNVSWVILCSIRSKNDLRMILNEYNVSDIDMPTMMKIWDYCSTPYEGQAFSVMKIATFHCALNKKLSKNYLEYITVKDFQVAN